MVRRNTHKTTCNFKKEHEFLFFVKEKLTMQYKQHNFSVGNVYYLSKSCSIVIVKYCTITFKDVIFNYIAGCDLIASCDLNDSFNSIKHFIV